MASDQTLLDWLGKDITAVYRVETYGQYPAQRWELDHKMEQGRFYYMPSQLCFGNYIGTSIEKSNIKIFLAAFEQLPQVRIIHSDYGTESIAIDVLCTNEKLIETLGALADYPVLNQEDLSAVEQELFNDAWESYIMRDFIDAINKKFDVNCYGTPGEHLFMILRSLMEQTNTYEQHGTGGGVDLDMARIMAGMDQLPVGLKLD